MKAFHYLLLLGTLLAASCQKDAPEAGLPAATQEGKNSGGCFVNGQLFVATGRPSGSILGGNPIPPLSGGFFYDSLYSLTLNGTYQGQSAEISLFIRSQQPGTYSLNKATPTLLQGGLSTSVLDHATFTYSSSNGEAFITDAQHTGQIRLVEASRNTGISAGTFEFTAASTLDPSKTVTITSGRFDRRQ